MRSEKTSVLTAVAELAGIDVPAQPITFTAHGWAAIVRNLRPGRHTIVGEALFSFGPPSTTHILNVVRRGHHARD